MPFTPLGMLPHLLPGAVRDSPRRGKINHSVSSKRLPKYSPVEHVHTSRCSSKKLSNLHYCLEQWTEKLNAILWQKQGEVTQCSSLRLATFSTSVGLAMEEEMTPERTPHITLISNVSSEREEWAADCKYLMACSRQLAAIYYDNVLQKPRK